MSFAPLCAKRKGTAMTWFLSKNTISMKQEHYFSEPSDCMRIFAGAKPIIGCHFTG